jgi:hypothetical protein
MTDPRAVRHRFAVDIERDEEALRTRLSKLSPLRPSGSVRLVAPFGFAYRREPDVFAAVATGASLGMGLLLSEISARAPAFTYVGRTLSVVFLLAGAALLSRFVANALGTFEVTAQGSDLVERSTLAGRTLRLRRFAASTIVSVLVVARDGDNLGVVLGGPRHEVLAELYRLKTLDPDALAAWLAEMIAVVARRASANDPAQ